jgi:hypothetical protein
MINNSFSQLLVLIIKAFFIEEDEIILHFIATSGQRVQLMNLDFETNMWPYFK